MNPKYSYKLVFLSIVFFCISCTKSNIKKTTIVQKQNQQQTNGEAYFNSHKPSEIELNYETDEDYLKRMQWWKDAKYGMFIHWGLYTVLAGEYKGKVTPKIAEWIQNTLKIPLVEYQKLMQEFNPKKFNADDWVTLAKLAGMKYIVLTSKHHDGFALYDSKVSEYDVMNTPLKKDVVKALKEACHKQGLKFGLYYSHVIDWEHPHAYVGGGKLQNRMNTVDFDANKMDRSIYLKEKAFPQLKELLTNYGTIDIIWFDMGKGLSNDEVRQFVKISKTLQPNIIISSRIGDEIEPAYLNKDLLFDFYTPSDNYFTGDNLAIPWEMAGTTNGSWGYRKNDEEWRKPQQILNSLVASVSRNGNYLLNVGPMADGLIPEEPVKNLKIVGNWLKSNGASIYKTQASPFPWNYNWGYVTQKPNKLYLNIFNWPKNNTIVLNGLLTKINSVKILGTDIKVKYTQNNQFVVIDISNVPKNNLATTLEIHHTNLAVKIATTISQNYDNTIRLDRICGSYINQKLLSSWKFIVHTPGTYNINIISNEKGRHTKPTWVGSNQKGSIQVAGKIIPVALKRDSEKVNPSLFFYKEITSYVGKIKFLKAGTYTLQLKGFHINAGKWANGLGLDRIELIPLSIEKLP